MYKLKYTYNMDLQSILQKYLKEKVKSSISLKMFDKYIYCVSGSFKNSFRKLNANT